MNCSKKGRYSDLTRELDVAQENWEPEFQESLPLKNRSRSYAIHTVRPANGKDMRNG